LIFHCGNANLEKLIKVGRENGAELQTLKERNSRLGCETQNALVEIKPTQFSVK
jgi:hypothetical protein